MPTPRTWLPRIDELVEILSSGSKTDLLDRGAVEKLFQVQRRQALLIIEEVGPVKDRGRHKVLRTSLLDWVRTIQANEGQELERRKRVSEELNNQMAEAHAARQVLSDAGRPAQSFALPQEILSSSLDSLPREIELSPGRIVVKFDPNEPESALQLLYQLGLALANDFDVFMYRNTARHTAIQT